LAALLGRRNGVRRAGDETRHDASRERLQETVAEPERLARESRHFFSFAMVETPLLSRREMAVQSPAVRVAVASSRRRASITWLAKRADERWSRGGGRSALRGRAFRCVDAIL
jgi:hypothetical protein